VTVRKRKVKLKLPKITTAEMEVAIAKYFGYRQHIIVPNLSWGFFSHECDLFLIRKSGYGFEVEIKRSKSDMQADFKKKHGHMDRRNRIVQLYYAFPKELLSKVEYHVPPECGILLVEKSKWNDGYYFHVKMHRDAKRKTGAKRLTQAEQLKIARLGTLRIWTLKETINKLIMNNGKTKV
jgi:hypothetical protein